VANWGKKYKFGRHSLLIQATATDVVVALILHFIYFWFSNATSILISGVQLPIYVFHFRKYGL